MTHKRKLFCQVDGCAFAMVVVMTTGLFLYLIIDKNLDHSRLRDVSPPRDNEVTILHRKEQNGWKYLNVLPRDHEKSFAWNLFAKSCTGLS